MPVVRMIHWQLRPSGLEEAFDLPFRLVVEVLANRVPQALIAFPAYFPTLVVETPEPLLEVSTRAAVEGFVAVAAGWVLLAMVRGAEDG